MSGHFKPNLTLVILLFFPMRVDRVSMEYHHFCILRGHLLYDAFISFILTKRTYPDEISHAVAFHFAKVPVYRYPE